MSIKTLLRRARRRMGMTQGELAWLLGVTVRSVQHWEAGRVLPRRGVLAKLYRMLKD